MITIEPIKKNEHSKILEIEQNLFENSMSNEELRKFLNIHSFKIWKIENIKIVGYMSFFQVKDEVEIIRLGIVKSYQRQNYGSFLINEIKKLDIKSIFLEVSVENTKAINFYLKNGFQKISLRKGYYKSLNGKRNDGLSLYFKR